MKLRAAVLLIIISFVAVVAAAQQPAENSSISVPHLIPYSGVARDLNGKPLSGRSESRSCSTSTSKVAPRSGWRYRAFKLMLADSTPYS
jgi:hypothetical protein